MVSIFCLFDDFTDDTMLFIFAGVERPEKSGQSTDTTREHEEDGT